MFSSSAYEHSSNLCVISSHQVPNPRVMINADANDRKHRNALPTASTNAERNELETENMLLFFIFSMKLTYEITYQILCIEIFLGD